MAARSTREQGQAMPLAAQNTRGLSLSLSTSPALLHLCPGHLVSPDASRSLCSASGSGEEGQHHSAGSDTIQYLSESKAISNPTQREFLLRSQQGRVCSHWAKGSTTPKEPQTAEEHKWLCHTSDTPKTAIISNHELLHEPSYHKSHVP